MIKSSKIFITIFFIALAGLLLYGFKIVRDRNSTPQNKEEQKQQTSQDNESEATMDESDDNSALDEEDSADTNEELADENSEIENTNFLDVSKNDCNNQCKNFTDSSELKYCQEICGITKTKKDAQESNSCDHLEDLEKDYCLKDLAITKNDVQICTQISDTNVFKACKNRIAQEFLESQQ